jgi:hypothetical protein
MLSVVMLSVVMQSVVMLSVVMLSVIKLANENTLANFFLRHLSFDKKSVFYLAILFSLVSYLMARHGQT